MRFSILTRCAVVLVGVSLAGCVEHPPSAPSEAIVVAKPGPEPLADDKPGTMRFGHEPEGLLELAFSPDGKELISASQVDDYHLSDVVIRRRDVATGRSTRLYIKCPEPAPPCAGSPDGPMPPAQAFSLSADGRLVGINASRIVVCDTKSGKPLHRFDPRGAGPVLSPDAQILVLSNGESRVYYQRLAHFSLIELASGKELGTIPGCLAAFSRDHQTCVAHDVENFPRENRLTVWTLGQPPTMFRRVEAHAPWRCGACALTADGKHLVCQCFPPKRSNRTDALLVCWEIATGRLVRQFKIESDPAYFQFSPDGKKVACVDGRTLRVWNAETGAKLMTVPQPLRSFAPSVEEYPGSNKLGEVWNGWLWDDLYRGILAFSPDGRMIASAGDDQIIHLWNTDTGAELTGK